MRIDREGFFLAVAALAGCQQDVKREPKPIVVQPLVKPASVAIAAVQLPPVALPEPAPPLPPPVVVPPRRTTPRQWFRGLSGSERRSVTNLCAHRAEVSCHLTLARMGPPPPRREDPNLDDDDDDTLPAVPPPPHPHPAINPEAKDLAMLKVADRERVAGYCKAEFIPPSCETPLVVAFDNQPVEFAQSHGEKFAFVPGDATATDWPTAVTPWIALDLDGDGAITSGAELFGSSTVLPGGGRANNGFTALAALDANGDGVIDARDPMFGKLVLWSDRNGDHRSSPDEVRPLSDTVTSISLAYTNGARCNDRDDCEGERATLHWRDAFGDHSGNVIDVYIPK